MNSSSRGTKISGNSEKDVYRAWNGLLVDTAITTVVGSGLTRANRVDQVRTLIDAVSGKTRNGTLRGDKGRRDKSKND